mmetsp:Transcript_139/g.262  ORF Transcript_139/g.262 Transcript_139/m.262 type:complete len:311 (+) Transcript_139:105-1037(+)
MSIRKPFSSPAALETLASSILTKNTSSQSAAKQHLSRRLLPTHTNLAARRKSTLSNNCNGARGPTPTTASAAAASQKRFFHSTLPKKSKPRNNNNETNNSNNTLSTLTNIAGPMFAAGMGTFTSTLFALYLATVVETSAHEFLYEYAPHWYHGVREEDLPHCLKSREMERRLTGLMELNRSRGVDTSTDSVLMGMDGWMEPTSNASSSMDAELLAEEEFEKQQQQQQQTQTQQLHTMAPWQRKMTEKRASIIAKEEQDFTVRLSSSSSSSSQSTKKSAKNGLFAEETKKMLQEEASRKLQERLMSVAMTA